MAMWRQLVAEKLASLSTPVALTYGSGKRMGSATVAVNVYVQDTENLRPHYAKTLSAWSDALEAPLKQAEEIRCRDRPAEKALELRRACRLYLAGCALAFERGWISLYQILATRPTGDPGDGILHRRQSAYPVQREYIYGRH